MSSSASSVAGSAARPGTEFDRDSWTEVTSMNERPVLPGSIRKLWPTETHIFRDHLLRLDGESRRMRFAHGVSEAFIADYASGMDAMNSVVYGYFVDGELHAAAELRKLGMAWGDNAEAAFSVEADYQNQGVGTELMGRVIKAARNRGVRHLYMSCLAENGRMQAIAQKHDAVLRYELGDVIGDIVPPAPSYFSFLLEAVEDRVGFMIAVLDLQQRMAKEA
jgi:GNAT superfamily N-acetyltransferase